MIMLGIMVMTIAASIDVQSVEYRPAKLVNPTGRVILSGSDIKTTAKINSFHMVIKLKMATVAMAVFEIGKRILQKTLPMVQPSMTAASSNSFGMVPKKAERMKIVVGSAKAT